MSTPVLRVIPLGGLGEIGRNMMAVECGDDIVLIDGGLMFPEDEMLGIDLVIPDVTYLLDKAQNIRGWIITHGHEDHTGGLPYLLPQLNFPPLYGTKLTMGLIKVKLQEHHLQQEAQLNIVQAGDSLQLGKLSADLFQVCHSIPDAVGVALHSPVGTIVHTGDFKLDHTPVDGRRTDYAKLARLSAEGVLALFSDSTRVEVPGYTPSEQVISETFDNVFANAPGRIIIATFASLISRVQQVIDASAKHGRRVGVVGRSMVNNVAMARELGYLSDPAECLRPIEELAKLPLEQVVIVTTGAQGEPTSALSRMANRDHRQINIVKGDTVILSSSPIPGNEELVARTIDSLYKQGANVLYHRLLPVHVSGHASQEEQKLMLNLVKPKFFVPIHGEYHHLILHGRLAQSLGWPAENVIVAEDGDILEFTADSARKVGKVPYGYVFVDGLGVGDIGTVVLRDRKALAQDGMLVAIIAVNRQTGKPTGLPDIITRGFVYEKGAEEMLEEARHRALEALNHQREQTADYSFVKNKVRDTLSKYLYEQTKRHPMILPVVVEV
ncbi:MAG TPA: ribonuclease J [Chloroflexota bacterium]|nr:ribonuclease J [Chloroflexota bacterium]